MWPDLNKWKPWDQLLFFTNSIFVCCAQVRPLPEVTASLEWTGRQVQQHGRAPCICGKSRLRPGHQVLLQCPRGSGLPHVSTRHTVLGVIDSYEIVGIHKCRCFWNLGQLNVKTSKQNNELAVELLMQTTSECRVQRSDTWPAFGWIFCHYLNDNHLHLGCCWQHSIPANTAVTG